MHRKYEVPPLDVLPTFEAAARHLSFTKAGDELALTQSAVSRQIQALEEALGVKLFQRRTRALLLTESGQILQRTAQEALQMLHDRAQKLRGVTEPHTVTVTTTPGFAALWLIPRLAGFTRTHPDVDVRISVTYDLVDVARAGVDLAIRYSEVESADGAPRLFGEEVLPVCSPALARDPARPLKAPQDLRHHVLLRLDEALLDWNLWLHALGLEDFRPAGMLHFSHYDQLIQAAIGGQGIALGRLPLIRQLLREKRLFAPFKKAVASSRAYFLVQSAAGASKPEVKDFAAWLIAETAKA